MQERLLSALSHHLRVPLNAIAGGLPQLRSGSEQAREDALAVLERSIVTEAALIANLNAAVELIATEPPAALERVELVSIVSPAVASLVEAARARRILVQWRPPSGSMPVMADRRYLVRAMARVCRSALATTPTGGRLHIMAGRIDGGRRLRVCALSVSAPRGRTLTARAAARRRARTAGWSRELDLCGALAREIVAAHGGSVTVRRSRRGRQAVVMILPTAGRPADHPRRPAFRPRPPRPARRTPASKERLPKVLLVDDYRDALDVWSFFLRSSGYDVFTAASGPEAIEQAQRYRPDVILLDLQLPGMSGFDTARALRATAAAATTPLVAVTGYSGSREHDEALASGVDVVMVKPVQPAALLQRIERLTQDGRGGAEGNVRA
jgi:CheY-like chemotaxis protein